MYLGGFATEDDAARAYDLAAVGCKGPSVEINFPLADYAEALRTDLAGLSQVDKSLTISRRALASAFHAVSIRLYTLHCCNALWRLPLGTEQTRRLPGQTSIPMQPKHCQDLPCKQHMLLSMMSQSHMPTAWGAGSTSK